MDETAIDDVTEDRPKRDPQSSGGFLGIYSSVGGTILGPYRVLEQVGHGGMGQVYKAQDLRLDRTVALKFLPPWKRGDSNERRQLTQEAKCASALNHPNIVTVYEIAEHDGVNFIVMEYVAGDTLERLIPHVGWPVDQVLRYALEIADALAAAHAEGILHGDLKPGNIMVTRHDRIKLLDFGLARELTSWPAESSEQGIRTRLGTTIWLAPEQLAESPARLDRRSEIFSFGLILHHMLSGGHPFGPGERHDIKAAILKKDPGALAETPPSLAAIVGRCLEKKIDDRFPSMTEVLSALRGFSEAPSRRPLRPSSDDAETPQIRGIAAKITYKNPARSREALKNLTRFIEAGASAATRQAINSALKEIILKGYLGGDHMRDAARDVRKRTLQVLQASTAGDLAEVFEAEDLEHLDLYGMDFSSARLPGFRFTRCFLATADFGRSHLARASFSGAWVRNVNFGGADLPDVDFTDADWFNAVGLTESQLRSVRRETLLACPSEVTALHRRLQARYGYPFESWGSQVQQQLEVAWTEYLRPGGLRDLVAGWQRASR